MLIVQLLSLLIQHLGMQLVYLTIFKRKLYLLQLYQFLLFIKYSDLLWYKKTSRINQSMLCYDNTNVPSITTSPPRLKTSRPGLSWCLLTRSPPTRWRWWTSTFQDQRWGQQNISNEFFVMTMSVNTTLQFLCVNSNKYEICLIRFNKSTLFNERLSSFILWFLKNHLWILEMKAKDV